MTLARFLRLRILIGVALTVALGLLAGQSGAQAATVSTSAVAGPVLAAPAAPPAPPNTFPITSSLGPVIIKDGWPWYESLSVTVSSTGRIDAVQRAYSHSWFAGFNGGAIVFLHDSAGNVLWSSQVHTVSVDGMYTFLPSDRTVYWSEPVPASVLATPGLQVKLALFENPQYTFLNWLKGNYDKLIQIILSFFRTSTGGKTN